MANKTVYPSMNENRASRNPREALGFCLGIVLVGALIQLFGAMKGDALVFPGVDVILQAFGKLIADSHTWILVGTSLRHLLLSMLIATAVGLTVGLAEGLSDFLRALFRPLMNLLRSIPMIVLVVIIMVLMPYPRVPVTASSLILIPIISEAANEGCRRIEPELIDVYKLNSGLNPRILTRVYLPLMAGYLRQAWINAAGMGLRLAISTEYMVQTRDSLGKAIYSSSYFNEYQDIYAYALIMILLVLLIGEAPSLIGRFISSRRVK
ncbi:MAG: ABC transporter permease subunit [Clostridia bacterium]|nr:ABC transporter permease subunit [Clostridia bacterium]